MTLDEFKIKLRGFSIEKFDIMETPLIEWEYEFYSREFHISMFEFKKHISTLLNVELGGDYFYPKKDKLN